MAIDVDRLASGELPPIEHAWRPQDVILYHLGVGAGQAPLDAGQLRYAYENDLVVLPSFSALAIMPLVLSLQELDGFDVPLASLLHAEHRLSVEGPLPARAEARTDSRIATVGDRGSGVLMGIESVTRGPGGEHLSTNELRLIARGEGPVGATPESFGLELPPEGSPSFELHRQTFPWQALLYRLSGDTNPLHVDPEVAAAAGFDRPIMHGLCTYGAVLHELVEGVLGGVVERVRDWRARFVGVVYPGERLRIEGWGEGSSLVARVTGGDSGREILIANLRAA